MSADNPHHGHIYICPFDDTFRPGKQYSLILMLDVLEHLENPASALRHVLDLLSPTGTFVATVPAFMSLWTNHDVLNHHFIRYTKATFRGVAQQTGLQIHEQRYLYHWFFPAKLSIRFLERTLHSDPVPAKVPSNWLNTTLYWLSRVGKLENMRRFYKPSLWIPQHFLLTNPNLHYGLLTSLGFFADRAAKKWPFGQQKTGVSLKPQARS